MYKIVYGQRVKDKSGPLNESAHRFAECITKNYVKYWADAIDDGNGDLTTEVCREVTLFFEGLAVRYNVLCVRLARLFY